MAPTFLAITLVGYTAARGYGEDTANRSFDRVLEGSALSILETLTVTDNALQVDVPYAALEMLSTAPDDRVFYRVFDQSGRSITGDGDVPPPPGQATDPIIRHAKATSFFDADYRGTPVRFALTGREVVQNDRKQWVWVEVGQTRLARESVMRESVLRALLPIAAMTLVALALVWFGISSALRPLRKLGDELASRDPSDFHPLDTAVPKEIAPLTGAINAYMLRLEANVGTLRSFIADASHQMRTPLAALLAQAYSSPRDSAADLRRSLAAVERNGTKLSHLLNQLLSDATVSHRSDVKHFSSVDLVELLSEVLAEVVRTLDFSDVRFTTKLKRALVHGDRLLLSEAFKNLIVNGAVHGGDTVQIDLVARDGGFTLLIADDGPGIPSEFRDRAFERFSRGATTAEGSGIGLAIVKQAIEAHGGAILLDTSSSGGLLVHVDLPGVS